MILELCPRSHYKLTAQQIRRKMKPKKIFPRGGHHVFQPAGGKIPAGSQCPVCDWTYDPAKTLKVRIWSLANRVRNMVRNHVILQVRQRTAKPAGITKHSSNRDCDSALPAGDAMGAHARPHGGLDRRRVRR